MAQANADAAQVDTIRQGLVAGLIAYSMWGVLPVYFKLLGDVTAAEVLAHRIIWAVPFGALILLMRRQWREVRKAFTDKATLSWLGLAAVCIAINWSIYIWAVQNGRIFEASLGYYINPLMYVLAGTWLFGESLRRLQILAVVFATGGVLVLMISGGIFPWVSLTLAAFFTAYGAIRKKVVIGAMPGLFVETTLLFPMALVYLLFLLIGGTAVFGSADTSQNMWLLAAGPVTVLPLMFFAVAARRLPLATVGFLQFLAPTMQFLTGIYYGEKLTLAHWICFSCIWIAVILFSTDAIRRSKKPLLGNPTRDSI